MLGAAAYLERYPDSLVALAILENGAERFKNWFLAVSSEDWKWFEPRIAYANARIPQALILAGAILERPALVGTGVRSLAWLVEKQQTPQGCFSPVGAAGASSTDFGTLQFDQQPIEASSTLSACLTAYKITNQQRFLDSASKCLEWFLGQNALGLPLANQGSGGCADGLEATGVNHNQGAESTLAYLAALTDMKSIIKTPVGAHEVK
jgi:hypothetical protein